MSYGMRQVAKEYPILNLRIKLIYTYVWYAHFVLAHLCHKEACETPSGNTFLDCLTLESKAIVKNSILKTSPKLEVLSHLENMDRDYYSTIASGFE